MSSYDQNLLGEAPRATRAQLQEGYNVNLLLQPHRRASSVHTSPQSFRSQPVTVPLTPVTAEADKPGTPAYTPAAPNPRASFWRSRTCFIATIVAFLIIIGAVVGGAVGGTIKKISDKVVTTQAQSPSTTSSPAPPTPAPTTQTAQGFGGGDFSTAEFTGSTTSTPTSRATSIGGQNTGGETIGVGAVANY